MSDLHRAVQGEINAFRPDRTPPFTALVDRHRSRSRRRRTLAVAAPVAVAVLVAPVAWSALDGGGDSLVQQADSTTPATSQPVFGLHPVRDVARIEDGSDCDGTARTLIDGPAGLTDGDVTACGLFVPEVYRLGPPAVTGDDVAKATAVPAVGGWVVQLDLTADGARSFARLSGEAACAPMGDPQRRLAYVLDGGVLNGEASVAPDVQCGVGITSPSSVLIVPDLDQGQARELAERIAASNGPGDE